MQQASVLEALEKKDEVRMLRIFLDFAKAFDTEILLTKLDGILGR